MSRNACGSYKGYRYQRIRLLHLIFEKYINTTDITSETELNKLNDITFQEEGDASEDINFYHKDEVYFYQEKYLNTNKNESLTKDSGFLKVLKSHYNKNNITKIYYEVVSNNKNINFTNRIDLFKKILNDNDNSRFIGVYIILLLTDKTFSNKIDHYNDTDNNYKYIIEYILLNIDIEYLNETIITYEEDDNILYSFLKYCLNEYNTSNLIIYLNKINISINNNTYEKIHNETLKFIQNKFELFNDIYNDFIMSENYKEYHTTCIYGFFEMICDDNLFGKNAKYSVKKLISLISDKVRNYSNDKDKINILLYTIKYFVYNNINEINKNDIIKPLSNIIINEKFTITIIIQKLKTKEINIDKNELRNFIRQIINNISIIINFNIVDDKQLLGFLKRTYDKLKLNGNNYKSLKNFNDCIIKYKKDVSL